MEKHPPLLHARVYGRLLHSRWSYRGSEGLLRRVVQDLNFPLESRKLVEELVSNGIDYGELKEID